MHRLGRETESSPSNPECPRCDGCLSGWNRQELGQSARSHRSRVRIHHTGLTGCRPQVQRCREGYRTVSDHLLYEREESKETQFAPMVLQRLRQSTQPQCLHPIGCGHETRFNVTLPLVESLRHRLQRGRRLWRDQGGQG